MGQHTATGVLRTSVSVAASAARAFEVFTTGLGTWWIRDFTWCGPHALDRVGMEPGVGGMCYETGPHGFRCDWGRVMIWEPPERLVFTWQIGPDRVPEPDPDRATEVEVRFTPDLEGRVRVELEHRGFARYGDRGPAYRDALAAGWDQLLARYAAAVG